MNIKKIVILFFSFLSILLLFLFVLFGYPLVLEIDKTDSLIIPREESQEGFIKPFNDISLKKRR